MSTALLTGSLIDLEHDELRPVADICYRKTGKRPAPQCVWRWRVKGCRGVRLECYLIQGIWQTTEAAFAAFIRGQTQAAIDSCEAEGHATGERTSATQRRLQSAGLI